MNRNTLNKILESVFKNCEALSDKVHICFEERPHLISCEDYENPVFDVGDINIQSIYTSERIAHLIDSFGKVSNFELRYRMILSGAHTDTMSLLLNNAADSIHNKANRTALHTAERVALSNTYLTLSDLIKKETKDANI